jgi:hypothetical protein
VELATGNIVKEATVATAGNNRGPVGSSAVRATVTEGAATKHNINLEDSIPNLLKEQGINFIVG